MTAQIASWSFAAGESSLPRYLREIQRFPMLEPQDEYMLAKRWNEHDDVDAAHKLVTSHLRLVAKIAMGYRGYGLPISEVISEGNVGLMQAVNTPRPRLLRTARRVPIGGICRAVLSITQCSG
jgi:RNA polymerase sigma-32 factor